MKMIAPAGTKTFNHGQHAYQVGADGMVDVPDHLEHALRGLGYRGHRDPLPLPAAATPDPRSKSLTEMLIEVCEAAGIDPAISYENLKKALAEQRDELKRLRGNGKR